jgi:hypothetical protein
MISAEKCDIIADSSPLFQYSQPKTIPPIPLKSIDRKIISGVSSTIAAVIGICAIANKNVEIIMALQ